MKISIIYQEPFGHPEKLGEFLWEVDEDFSEIKNIWWRLRETSAEAIENFSLSVRAKILLSAVAGAAFQLLIDNKKFNSDVLKYAEFIIKEGE